MFTVVIKYKQRQVRRCYLYQDENFLEFLIIDFSNLPFNTIITRSAADSAVTTTNNSQWARLSGAAGSDSTPDINMQHHQLHTLPSHDRPNPSSSRSQIMHLFIHLRGKCQLASHKSYLLFTSHKSFLKTLGTSKKGFLFIPKSLSAPRAEKLTNTPTSVNINLVSLRSKVNRSHSSVGQRLECRLREERHRLEPLPETFDQWFGLPCTCIKQNNQSNEQGRKSTFEASDDRYLFQNYSYGNLQLHFLVNQ